MKRICLVICIASLFALSAFAQNDNKQTTSPPAKGSYEELVAKLKNGDTKIDYRELRISASKRPGSAEVSNAQFLAMSKAFKDENPKELARLAEAALAVNYADTYSHMYASAAYLDLNQKMQADLHKIVHTELFNSMMKGKDGKTASTAFTVVNDREALLVLSKIGLKPTDKDSQTAFKGGRIYYIIPAIDMKTSVMVEVYFYYEIPPPTS